MRGTCEGETEAVDGVVDMAELVWKGGGADAGQSRQGGCLRAVQDTPATCTRQPGRHEPIVQVPGRRSCAQWCANVTILAQSHAASTPRAKGVRGGEAPWIVTGAGQGRDA